MRARGPVSGILAAVLLTATAAVMHLGLAAVLLVAPAAAQVTNPSSFPAIDGERPTPGALPNRLAGQTGIQEHLGERVTPGLRFQNEAGETVELASLLGRDKPVVVAFVYHSCPMLCSLILDGVMDGVENLDGLTPGADYDVLAVSFDPRDTPEVAARAEAKYAAELGRPGVEAGLHFWTVTPETEDQVERLADELGFGYAYDAQTGEYAHNAAAMFLAPDGTITRYLYGVQFDPLHFRLAVVESGEGKVGSTLDRFLLTCFAYDPDTKSYSLAILTSLKIGAGLLTVLLGALLVTFWRRESARRARPDDVLGPDLPSPSTA